MYDMTAAHLKLPMGSYVKVTNLRNGKSVMVRINDRGPVVPGRIIDLSLRSRTGAPIPAPWPATRPPGSGEIRTPSRHPSYQMVAYNHPPVAQLP